MQVWLGFIISLMWHQTRLSSSARRRKLIYKTVSGPQITASNSLSRKQNISQTIFLPKNSWKGCTASNSQQAVLSEQKWGGRGKEALSRKVARKAGRPSASQSCKKGVGGKLHTILEVVCEPVWKYTIHPLYFSLLSSSYYIVPPPYTYVSSR